MELFSGKYRPSWSSVCGGSDVKGIMELADTTYKPKPEAHGICSESDISALSRMMVKRDDSSLYYPRVILNNQEMCCAGNNCENCDGELWENGETPKKVEVIVSGVDWETSGCGEADPNGTYILGQTSNPCIWAVSSGIFYIYYQAYSQVPCSPAGQSSCIHVFSDTLLGASTNKWYFRNCHDACGRDHGGTYYNGDIAVTDCCTHNRVGGCDFLPYKAIPSAAFGGQAVVSWPI